MSRHTLRIYNHDGFSKYVVCLACKDPESEVCNYIWTNADGDVIFDSDKPEQLFNFLIWHDALKLCDVQ
jgi:hypothetical protein